MVKSTAFLTLIISLVRYLFCKIGYIQGSTDRLTGILATALASTVVFLEPQSRRKELALYLAPKAIEGMYNYMARRHYLPVVPNMENYVFALSLGIIAVGLKNRKDYLKPTYQNVFNTLWG